MKNIGLYVHIPFCKAKCKYCDFLSYAGLEDKIPAYFSSLLTEIHDYKDKNIIVDSVFIGGGTPSVVNHEYIVKILETVFSCFTVTDSAEITIEANPGTINPEALKAYCKAGINRLSMGVQSANENELKALGRIHTWDTFERSFNDARQAGFRNINADLIFGIPEQNTESWSNTLNKIIALDPEHISCYSLIVEENTVFSDMDKNGRLILPGDDDERDMYYTAEELLNNNGYMHYEISNFSKKGFECRHNIKYWECDEYIGVGIGAHSFYNKMRFSNTGDMGRYIEYAGRGSFIRSGEHIDKCEAMKEFMMLGLRKTSGIDKADFFRRYNENCTELFKIELDKLSGQGLIIIDDKGVRLTEKGLDFANLAFMEFV